MSQLDFIETQNSEFIWPSGLSSAIGYIDNVIPEKFCSEIIDLFSSMEERSFPGMTLSGEQSDIKTTTDWHMDQHYESPKNREQQLDTIVYNNLWSTISLYQKQFPFLDPYSNIIPLNIDSGYQVQRYKKGAGFYKEHIDASPWQLDVSSRVLAAIIYLNTVDVGGETRFPLHDISIKPITGRIALFPASWTHPHIAQIPYSSDKWIISTFISYGFL